MRISIMVILLICLGFTIMAVNRIGETFRRGYLLLKENEDGKKLAS
jgi:hypothetical protein